MHWYILKHLCLPLASLTNNEKLSFAIGVPSLAIPVDKDTVLCQKQFTGCDEAVHPVLHPLSLRGLRIVTEFQHLTYENRLVKGAFYLYSNLQKARRLEADPLTIDHLIRYGHNHFANISLLILIETL